MKCRAVCDIHKGGRLGVAFTTLRIPVGLPGYAPLPPSRHVLLWVLPTAFRSSNIFVELKMWSLNTSANLCKVGLVRQPKAHNAELSHGVQVLSALASLLAQEACRTTCDVDEGPPVLQTDFKPAFAGKCPSQSSLRRSNFSQPTPS